MPKSLKWIHTSKVDLKSMNFVKSELKRWYNVHKITKVTANSLSLSAMSIPSCSRRQVSESMPKTSGNLKKCHNLPEDVKYVYKSEVKTTGCFHDQQAKPKKCINLKEVSKCMPKTSTNHKKVKFKSKKCMPKGLKRIRPGEGQSKVIELEWVHNSKSKLKK